MALSLATIGTASGNGTIVAQVTAGLQSTVTTVLAESSATADYVVRRKFAQLCEKNIQGSALAVLIAVVMQVAAVQTSYTQLSQITDTDVTGAIAAIFTQLSYATILPS